MVSKEMRNNKNWFDRLSALIIISLFYFSFIYIAYIFVGNWFTDDAFISFRYAKYFSLVSGLIFNDNEYVQGYTNFLWTIIIGGFLKLGWQPTLSSILLNTVSTYLLGIVFYFFLLRHYSVLSKQLMLCWTLYMISFPNLLTWTVGGGLEAPFFTLIVFMAFYFYSLNISKWLLVSSVAYAFASLIRPEGLILFLLNLLSHFAEVKILVNKKKFMLYIIPFILIMSIYLIWSYAYYGSIIPNTFYAKFTPIFEQLLEGLHYVYTFFMSVPLLPIAVLLVLINFNNLNPISKYCFLVFCVYVLYLVIVGGDFMSAHRFFIPLTPFIVLTIIDLSIKYSNESFRFLRNQINYSAAIVVSLIVMNLLTISYAPSYKTQIKNYHLIENGKKAAIYFNKNLKPNYTIATSAIGAFGYYANMKILDIVGLTEPRIAKNQISKKKDEIISHNRSNVSIVMQLKPAVIIFGGHPGSIYPERFADKEIYNHPIFKKEYSLKKVKIDSLTVLQFYLRNGIIIND
jgi:hypothetical protein